MKTFCHITLILAIFSAPAFASVTVSSPANGGTVTSPVQFTANATTTTCSKGVASMGVYVNNQLVTVQNGISLNASVSLAPGSYNTVVEEWDYCGGATFTPVTISVTNQSGVFVTSPANNSTVGTPANYIATAATTSCSKGVASMGVYVNNQLVTVQNGATLNTQVNLGAGSSEHRSGRVGLLRWGLLRAHQCHSSARLGQRSQTFRPAVDGTAGARDRLITLIARLLRAMVSILTHAEYLLSLPQWKGDSFHSWGFKRHGSLG
jgi:hypothetical protein